MNKLFAALVVSALVVTPEVSSSQAEVGRDEAVWTWDGRVASGKWFRLSSVNGPVSVEPSNDNMVHVRAEKQVNRGDLTEVAFQVVESDGDVRICALWRRDVCDEDGLHTRRNPDDRNDRSNVKVKFTIKIPAGVHVSAGTVNGDMRVRDVSSDVRVSTVNGLVEVQNAGGEVHASTVNGGIAVTTRSGPVNANTVNGDIDVRMYSLSRDGEMKFSTVNGSVTVETPPGLDADVMLETMHGSLSSDWPVQLSGKFGPRRAEGTIGRGGRSIRLKTLNGSVELRKAR